MIIDSLKRTSSALVALRKFQLRTPISNVDALFERARVIVRPIIEEFSQQPALTYQRLRNYLDDFENEYSHIRCFSIFIVIAKTHNYSDTALEPILAALITAQRIEQYKAQRTNASIALPEWLKSTLIQTVDNRDLFLQVLRSTLTDNNANGENLGDYASDFNWQVGLNLARFIAGEFSHQPKTEFIELTCLANLSANTMALEQSISPLLSPSSPFWARVTMHYQSSIGFLLYATSSQLKVAIRETDKNSGQDIRIDTKPHAALYESAIGKSQISFKIWLKTLVKCHQVDTDYSQQIGIPEYPIQRPPTDLLQIIHALHKPSTEPAMIAKLISNSHFFSKTLQRSAQQLNRMSIPVNDVKQSILTHGMERVGTILTEQVLWFRLTRADFPLKKRFERLVQLHRFISASLAHSYGNDLPQQASLCATLQLSFLFTHPRLRVLTNWQDMHSADDMPDSLFSELDTNLPLNSALVLAKAWHQPSDIIKPLRYFQPGTKNELTKTSIEVLKVSLILTRTWISGKEIDSAHLQSLSKRYQHVKLQYKQLCEIRNNAAEYIYCGLA